jgi:hypothetical protein
MPLSRSSLNLIWESLVRVRTSSLWYYDEEPCTNGDGESTSISEAALDEAACDDVLLLVEQNDSAHPRLFTAFLSFSSLLHKVNSNKNKASGKYEGLEK